MKKVNWKILFAVSWLVLVGGFIRAWGWQAYYFSPDDMMHLRVADQPTLAQVWDFGQKQVHPPLLYFVYHLALQISRNGEWLRSISLAAGLATMVVLFFIGRKAVGNLAGVVMVALTAFSYGHILLSQVVRHYSLLLLFLSLTIWFFISYHHAPKNKYLFGFALAGLLTAITHYSGMIPLAGMGLAWLIFAAAKKKPWPEFLKLGLAFLPTVLALAIFYLGHVEKIFTSGLFDRLQANYLNPYFASSLPEFGINLREQFGYLFLPPASLGLMALALAGLLVLWKRGRKETAAAATATFILAVVLMLTKKYPLGGSRHGIYLLPFVALQVGGGLQGLWAWLTGETDCRVIPSFPFASRVRARQKYLAGLGLAALIIIPFLLLPWFRKNDFLRRYAGQSWMEFPLTKENYRKTFGQLLQGTGPGDIVLTTSQTSFYLMYESRREAKALGDGLKKIEYNGLTFYFDSSVWTYDDLDRFSTAMRKLRAQTGLTHAPRLWLFNLGWGRGFPEELEKTARTEKAGGTLYGLDRPRLEALLGPAQ